MTHFSNNQVWWSHLLSFSKWTIHLFWTHRYWPLLNWHQRFFTRSWKKICEEHLSPLPDEDFLLSPHWGLMQWCLVFFYNSCLGFYFSLCWLTTLMLFFLSERLQSLPHSSLLPPSLPPCIVVTPPDTTQLKACVYQHTLSPHIQNSQVMWFNLLCGALTLTPHD